MLLRSAHWCRSDVVFGIKLKVLWKMRENRAQEMFAAICVNRKASCFEAISKGDRICFDHFALLDENRIIREAKQIFDHRVSGQVHWSKTTHAISRTSHEITLSPHFLCIQSEVFFSVYFFMLSVSTLFQTALFNFFGLQKFVCSNAKRIIFQYGNHKFSHNRILSNQLFSQNARNFSTIPFVTLAISRISLCVWVSVCGKN